MNSSCRFALIFCLTFHSSDSWLANNGLGAVLSQTDNEVDEYPLKDSVGSILSVEN